MYVLFLSQAARTAAALANMGNVSGLGIGRTQERAVRESAYGLGGGQVRRRPTEYGFSQDAMKTCEYRTTACFGEFWGVLD